jgi:putative FmdB family regulatory protein
MPLYDFHCDSCETDFEAVSDPGKTAPCPACRSDDTRRVWTAPAMSRHPGLRGHAARVSNANRFEREEARRERMAKRKEERRKGESG